MKRTLATIPTLFFTATTLLAQTATPGDDGAMTSPAGTPELSKGAIAAIVGGSLLPFVFGIALWLGIAIWVTKDAARRNSPNKTLVTVLAWIPCTNLIGLIVHLVTRPKTTTV